MSAQDVHQQGYDASHEDGIRLACKDQVFALKKRPDSKSLVLLAADLDMVARYIKIIPPVAIDLVEVNDKPMTIVYPGAICGKKPAEGEEARTERHLLAWNTVAEDGSVGIRIPLSAFCRDLVARLGRPLVSTSANLSGEKTAKVFADISQPIREGVDYIVEPYLEKEATGEASQIIKLEVDGQVTIIRA